MNRTTQRLWSAVGLVMLAACGGSGEPRAVTIHGLSLSNGELFFDVGITDPIDRCPTLDKLGVTINGEAPRAVVSQRWDSYGRQCLRGSLIVPDRGEDVLELVAEDEGKALTARIKYPVTGRHPPLPRGGDTAKGGEVLVFDNQEPTRPFAAVGTNVFDATGDLTTSWVDWTPEIAAREIRVDVPRGTGGEPASLRVHYSFAIHYAPREVTCEGFVCAEGLTDAESGNDLVHGQITYLPNG